MYLRAAPVNRTIVLTTFVNIGQYIDNSKTLGTKLRTHANFERLNCILTKTKCGNTLAE